MSTVWKRCPSVSAGLAARCIVLLASSPFSSPSSAPSRSPVPSQPMCGCRAPPPLPPPPLSPATLRRKMVPAASPPSRSVRLESSKQMALEAFVSTLEAWYASDALALESATASKVNLPLLKPPVKRLLNSSELKLVSSCSSKHGCILLPARDPSAVGLLVLLPVHLLPVAAPPPGCPKLRTGPVGETSAGRNCGSSHHDM
mmetsp:Transcript_56971/g.144555  ORF Transcript_56971/g.144555 Transcript_56971/m.144555 type:complete len:201 (-) Transcript_56971:1998-2600(-)